MPYSDHYEQLEYYQLWYSKHRIQHLEKMIQYYYDNRSKNLKQRKININNLKIKNSLSLSRSDNEKTFKNFFIIYSI